MIAKNKKPERVEDKRLNEVKGIYDLKKMMKKLMKMILIINIK